MGRKSQNFQIFVSFLLTLLILSGCESISSTDSDLSILLRIDNETRTISAKSGESVREILTANNIDIGNLDKITPPEYTEVKDNIEIEIIRVNEEFLLEEEIVPFDRQTVKNESLPEGQTLLIQPGKNGKLEITHRILFENGVITDKDIVRSLVIEEPQPEILMIGVQAPFSPIQLIGKIAYLSSGNAWVMEETTGLRRPVVTTGDLDGRIFKLSPKAKWLLYTRDAAEDDDINSLWTINLTDPLAKPIDLNVNNVIHFADWVPNQANTIVYSTVEPRSTPPGWQANNNLISLKFNETGANFEEKEIISTNSGGIYGWWGTLFTWSNLGDKMAFSRPDSIGFVDLEDGQLTKIFDILPYQTRSDWAWIPGIGFSSDDSLLYLTYHLPSEGLSSDEYSPFFDLMVYAIRDNYSLTLVKQTGMFSYPSPSPYPGSEFVMAYLQSIFPEQSDSSRYRVTIMDRDGSNKLAIFPPEGSNGIEPQKIVWSPNSSDNNKRWIGLLYQGNLWLINVDLEQAQQISGDGSIQRIDWQ